MSAGARPDCWTQATTKACKPRKIGLKNPLSRTQTAYSAHARIPATVASV